MIACMFSLSKTLCISSDLCHDAPSSYTTVSYLQPGLSLSKILARSVRTNSIVNPFELACNNDQYVSPYVSIAVIIVILGEIGCILPDSFKWLGIHDLPKKLLSPNGV